MSELDQNKIQRPDFERPHVVILGAGASLAAFPNGDKNGRKLPLMNSIVDVVGLGPLLDEAGIYEHRDDFETLYSNLVTSGTCPELLGTLEQDVFDYFAGMELPSEPTLYDHLVLSLREKDVIATFNWDPFLVQAWARNKTFASLPYPLFLHGNTAMGHCVEHKPIAVGNRGNRCRICGKPLQDSRLLYPVAEKNYNADPFIAKSWELLHKSLEDAFLVTVFGYGALVTDVEAVDLLKGAWGDPDQRELEEVEIIDIKSENELCETWKDFIPKDHYRPVRNFYDSILANHPRRSCEVMWSTFVELAYVDANLLPHDSSWIGLRKWLRPIVADEKAHNAQTTTPT